MNHHALQGIKTSYADRLYHVYQQVVNCALHKTAEAITQHLEVLVAILATTPSMRSLSERAAQVARSGLQTLSVSELQAHLDTLNRIADEAYQGFHHHAKWLEEAVLRYEADKKTVSEYALGARYEDPALNSALEQFEHDVMTRCTHMADALAEGRYDQAAYTQMLLEQVLDVASLVALIEGALGVGYKQQQDRWKKLAVELGITQSIKPSKTPVNIEPLTQAFLMPIQLRYERPGMLRTITQALTRGKFREELAAEIHDGLAQMHPCVIKAIHDAWNLSEQGWQLMYNESLLAILKQKTGTDKEGSLSGAEECKQKMDVITLWRQELQQLTPQQEMAGWYQLLYNQAQTTLATRLQHDTQIKRPR